MRAMASAPRVDLEMKSLAPALRARSRVSSSSLPEITRKGSSRTRACEAARMRPSRPKPSSFGMPRSEITATMVESLSIAAQPASPSPASSTSNEARITLPMELRTTFESSTISTRGRLSMDLSRFVVFP
jgi:hypothetical protein